MGWKPTPRFLVTLLSLVHLSIEATATPTTKSITPSIRTLTSKELQNAYLKGYNSSQEIDVQISDLNRTFIGWLCVRCPRGNSPSIRIIPACNLDSHKSPFRQKVPVHTLGSHIFYSILDKVGPSILA
jgi:hypothetical protein